MTKAIRIENADSAIGFSILVQVWDKGKQLDNGGCEPDTLVRQFPINHPTAMIEECIHSTRYLVVKEV